MNGAPPLAPIKGAVPEARAGGPAPAALILDCAHPGNWLAVMGCRGNPHSKVWEWQVSGLKAWAVLAAATRPWALCVEGRAHWLVGLFFERRDLLIDDGFKVAVSFPHGADFHL
jgi:hypothetical protein